MLNKITFLDLAMASKRLVEDLWMRGVDVARYLGVTGAAVSQAVEHGRQFALERQAKLVPNS